MKKVLILFILSAFTLAGFSQGFEGFLKPIDKSIFGQSMASENKGFSLDLASEVSSVWIIRKSVAVTALRMTRDYVMDENGEATDVKKWNGKLASAAGVGLSYGNYILVDGEPYCRFSADVLLMTTTMINGEEFGLGVGAFVTLWEYFKVGVDYINKQVGINTGVTIKFN